MIIFYFRLVSQVAKKLDKLVAGGAEQHVAWNLCSVELVKCAEVRMIFCFYL